MELNGGTQEDGSYRSRWTMLSKVVVVSVVKGVEQVCVGGWERVARGRAGHILRRKHAVAASIFNQ
jgi:hypothetical protein